MKWVKYSLISLLVLFCLLVLCGFALWGNRLTIAELGLKNILQRQGIEAEFFVKKIDRNQIIIGDLVLDHKGHALLHAKSLILDYEVSGRDISDVLLKRVVLNQPVFSAVFPDPNVTPKPFDLRAILSHDHYRVLFKHFPLNGFEINDGLVQWQIGAKIGGGENRSDPIDTLRGNVDMAFDFNFSQKKQWQLKYLSENFQLILPFQKAKGQKGADQEGVNDPYINLMIAGAMEQKQGGEITVFGEVACEEIIWEGDTLKSAHQNHVDDLRLNYHYDIKRIKALPTSVLWETIDVQGWAKNEISQWSMGANKGGLFKARADVKASLSLAPIWNAVATNRVRDGEKRNDVFWQSQLEKSLLDFVVKWQARSNDNEIGSVTSRAELAQRITGWEHTNSLPIFKQFAFEITDKVDQALQGFSVQMGGGLSFNDAGFEVNISPKFSVVSDAMTLDVLPQLALSGPDLARPEIKFTRADQLLSILGEVQLGFKASQSSNIPNIKISNIELLLDSETGFDIGTITNFKSRVETDQEWLITPKNNILQAPSHSRLGAVDIDLSFGNDLEGGRTASIFGGLEYDGPVLSNLVSGLQVAGRLVITQDENGQELDVKLSKPVSLDRLKMNNGWEIKNLKFDLEQQGEQAPRFQNSSDDRADPSKLYIAKISNFKADFKGPNDQRHFNTAIENLALSFDFNPQGTNNKDIGQVIEEKQNNLQSIWMVQAKNVKILSDDFPAPGSKIISKHADVRLEMSGGGGLVFELKSPHTLIETDNVKVDDIEIKANGDSDHIVANYKAHSVLFKNGDIPQLPFIGDLEWRGGAITGGATTNLPHSEQTPIHIQFNSKQGQGGASIHIPIIHFDPSGLQPQTLISSLRGKLAEVTGDVSADFEFEFGGGLPIRSWGMSTITDMDIGTLVGPFSGVNTALEFSSIFPLKTKGVQAATISGFDPGFPLDAGLVRFEIIQNGIRIDQAQWPVFSKELNIKYPYITSKQSKQGMISIDPMIWRFEEVENRAVIRVQNVDLGHVFGKIGRDKLEITGLISGQLPAVINGVDVAIDQGKLSIENGGVIRLKTGAAKAASERNEYAGHGIQALENFEYRSMNLSVDGPLGGSVNLGMEFEGYNPEVLNGQPFAFNVDVAGELGNIARNLSRSLDTARNVREVMELQSP